MKYNLLLIFLSTLFAITLVEISLRIVGYTDPSLYRADPCCGASLIPNAEGIWDQEGHANIKINSQGLRDIEHDLIKPDGTIRIAILGDSYAEALQLPIEQTFWSIMQKELNQCSSFNGINIEVINFGVSGYGTAQQLQTLRHKVWDYDPDIVLLAFLTGNDVRNNHRVLEGDTMRPYYIFDDNGNLVLDDSYLQDPRYLKLMDSKIQFFINIIDYSRVLQLLNENRRKFRAHLQAKRATQISEQQNLGNIGLDNSIYNEPKTADLKEAWRVTEKLIFLMNQEVTKLGKHFLFVTLSNGTQVILNKEIRENFKNNIKSDDLFYPDRRLEKLAVANNIDHIILAPKLYQWVLENNTCVHGFENTSRCGGHWNQHGHKLAGNIISEHLCNSNVIKLFNKKSN